MVRGIRVSVLLVIGFPRNDFSKDLFWFSLPTKTVIEQLEVMCPDWLRGRQ
jgi:hypothetical protein